MGFFNKVLLALIYSLTLYIANVYPSHSHIKLQHVEHPDYNLTKWKGRITLNVTRDIGSGGSRER